ncbi:MAG: SGNH/GDSL hydrolase family protein [Planctomycetota bacterium]
MTPRVRTILERSAAVAFGAALALFALEGGYRLLRVRGLGPTTNPAYVEHDAQLGWRYRSGARERHRTTEFDVEIAINSRGFRGEEWPPRDGRKRALVLGDSFAFGWGVEHSESFSSVLERLAPDWQVLNAAVSGYGTDQELLLLETLASEVEPDLVVVVYCSNDRMECASVAPYGRAKPYFTRRGRELVVDGVPIEEPWLVRHSYLARAIAKWLAERRRPDRDLDPNREWALVCDLYRAMRDRARGLPLLVVSSEERLARFAREEKGLHHLDLRPALAEASVPVEFPIDRHWTAAGHALVAREIARTLPTLVP